MSGRPRTGAVADLATAERPPRRRASWNLRTIVEDVAGRPIEELQDPARPPHPYLRERPAPPIEAPSAARGEGTPELSDGDDDDPVDRIRPPFVGAAGRAFHGPEHEHHPETLVRHRATPGAGGPLRRPERIYLHYLLLHLDRLGEPSLRYLRSAIDEELDHRRGGREELPGPETAAGSRTSDPKAGPPTSAPAAAPPPLPDDAVRPSGG